MKNERKEFGEQQTYFPKSSQELINRSEQRDTTNETSDDDLRHGEECYSKLPKRTLEECETAKHAERLAVNYVRSLLLF